MNYPKKILIIDDNPDLLEIMQINLESAGYTVATSTNGLSGIVDILQFHPDVVILDIMMPEMSGYDVLRTLREQSSIRIPIIVCSNLSQESDIRKALDAGADIYLQKSEYPGDMLTQKVTEFLTSLETHSA
jgi:CheY-like chemotaxis protein